jgi:hypothetical protein
MFASKWEAPFVVHGVEGEMTVVYIVEDPSREHAPATSNAGALGSKDNF